MDDVPGAVVGGVIGYLWGRGMRWLGGETVPGQAAVAVALSAILIAPLWYAGAVSAWWFLYLPGAVAAAFLLYAAMRRTGQRERSPAGPE